MNDPAEYEGSGINPGSEINPIKEIVESVRHGIISTSDEGLVYLIDNVQF